jgi:hypothetical protein
MAATIAPGGAKVNARVRYQENARTAGHQVITKTSEPIAAFVQQSI